METEAGNQNDGLRLALYFTRKASSITSPMQILADPALTQVVQTALGLSPTVSAGAIDAQAAMLSKLINISDFQDPTKVTQFAERFAAMWDATQNTNSSDSVSAPQILIGQSAQMGLDVNTLTALQNIRIGG